MKWARGFGRVELDKFYSSGVIRQFESASWLTRFDNNQMKAEDWDKSSLRVLVCFLSPGVTRAVSNTYTALDSLIREASPDIFVDYSYFPTKGDLPLYKKYDLPFWFGNVSRRPATDYDLLIVSSSILVEFINIFSALDSLKIPRWHKDRVERKDIPLIMAGGIPIADHDAMGGNSGLVDIVYTGYAEGNLALILSEMLRIKKEGKNPNSHKMTLIRRFVTGLSNIYYPDGYEVVYDKEFIKEIKPRYAWVPKEVSFHTEHNLDKFPGFERKIFNPDNSNASGSDLLISAGCSGGGICSFCMEGTACGGWRERSFDRMIQSLEECKRYTASNTIGFYSFNFNYYSRFVDIIYEAASRFSSLSLINLRTDLIGAAPEYFQACLALGIRRLSMPIEGFGERVRNKILNKSLTFEQIKAAFKSAFAAGLMEVKIGMILSGHETAEDLEVAAQEFEELYRMKEEAQSGAGLRANITPLVYYPHTAMGWMKQNTSNISLKEMRLMKPLLDRLRGKVRFKFNGQHFGTFIEQATLNLGRLGTPIWEKVADSGYNYYASPTKEVVQTILDELKDRGLSLQKFLDEKSFDYIFPTDMIPKKTKKYNKLVFDSAGVKEIAPCTKTVIRENPKCYNCGYCTTQEMKDSILKRKIFNNHTAVDIQEKLFTNKAQGAYRVGFRVKNEFSMVGKEALAFSITSRFLQVSEEIYNEYHSVHNISNSPMLRGNLWDWMSGSFYYDIHIKSREVAVEWDRLIAEVNKGLFSAEVFSVSPVVVKDRQSENVQVISVVELKGVSLGQVRDWVKNQKGEVKVGAKGRVTGNEVMLESRELPYCEVELAQTKTAVRIALIHPIWMNPYLYVATQSRFSYKKVMEVSNVHIAGYFGDEVGICKCGKATRVSEISRKEAPLCSSCLAKVSLVRWIST